MRVLLLASGVLGLSIMESLLALQKTGEIEIVGVFPWSKSKKGQTLKDLGEKQLVKAIKKHRLKMIYCPGANHFSFSQQLQTLKPDVVIVGCWGEILKPHVVNRTDIKLVNCHPSKLPAHRGANPYVSALINRDALDGGESGVTFHWVSSGIDEGPIILQEAIPLRKAMTGDELRAACCEKVKTMVPGLIEKLRNTGIADYPPQPQEGASYYPQISLIDGLLRWEQPPDEIINRMKALTPWLTCFSMLQGQLLYIFHELLVESRAAFQANYPHLALLSGDVPNQIPPGTIVAKQQDTIWIQSSEQDVLFRARDIQFYLGWGFLPKPVSRFLNRGVLKIGQRFLQAFVQGVVAQSQQGAQAQQDSSPVL